jgi:hypothetical protein
MLNVYAPIRGVKVWDNTAYSEDADEWWPTDQTHTYNNKTYAFNDTEETWMDINADDVVGYDWAYDSTEQKNKWTSWDNSTTQTRNNITYGWNSDE